MGDGTREEVEACGPTEEQDQQQFEEEVQQWEREEREVTFIRKAQKARWGWEAEYNVWLDTYGHSDCDWWKPLDEEMKDASDGHSGTETKETLPSK